MFCYYLLKISWNNLENMRNSENFSHLQISDSSLLYLIFNWFYYKPATSQISYNFFIPDFSKNKPNSGIYAKFP